MKKSVQLLIFLLLVAAVPAMAQSTISKAELNKKGIIQLPLEKPLEKSYEIDIRNLNFESDKEAVSWFSNYRGDGFFMRPVFHKSIAIVYLQDETKADWTAKEWNKHFEKVMNDNPLIKKS